MKSPLKLMVLLASLKFSIIVEGIMAWYLAGYLEQYYPGYFWEVICILLWLVLACCQLYLFIRLSCF
ncbi:MAG: hypothetical protein OXC40_01505 [Proteobacteria bacterium]|nr:hypothetical protein [Pseudomonadota bacterium]